MSDLLQMTSSRPYLIRALNDWIIDNEMTPYIVVDAHYKAVQVPQQYVEAGKIVLNLSPTAVRDLCIDNDHVLFSARFGGVSMDVIVPIHAVLAVYAKENGQGMVFGGAAEFNGVITDGSKQLSKKAIKPNLTLVK